MYILPFCDFYFTCSFIHELEFTHAAGHVQLSGAPWQTHGVLLLVVHLADIWKVLVLS